MKIADRIIGAGFIILIIGGGFSSNTLLAMGLAVMGCGIYVYVGKE